MDKALDRVCIITKYTPDECVKYEGKRRKRAFAANYSELSGGFVFFILTLICTYMLFDRSINECRDYCSFLTEWWNFIFDPLISTGKSLLVRFLIGILYSFGISVLISVVIGVIFSLFYRKKEEFVWEKSRDSLEQYRAVLESVQKDVISGWTFLYMGIYILFFVVYTVVCVVKDPEVGGMNILILLLCIITVAIAFAILGFILYSIFCGILGSLFKGRKLARFERELRDYVEWETAENNERLEFERKKRAEQLYQDAISKDTVDEELMQEAVDLGNPDAIVYRAKKLVFECVEKNGVTEEMKESLYKTYGLIYDLEYAYSSVIVFLKCFCSAYVYDLSFSALVNTQMKLVEIEKKGDLPEEYEKSYIMLREHIKKLISEKPSGTIYPEPEPSGRDPWDDVPDVDIDVSNM